MSLGLPPCSRVLLHGFATLFFIVSGWLNAASAAATGPTFTLRPDQPKGLYQPGETVTWMVEVGGDRSGIAVLPYVVKSDGQDEIAKGEVDLTSGTATIAASRKDPGALVAWVQPADIATNKYARPLGIGAAVFAADKIGPSAPAPTDFDTFWQAKLKELAQVPVNPQLQKVEGLPKSEGIDYYKVTLDNIRGTHVQGQLTRPTVGEKFPAILMVQFAGVYALDKNQVLAEAHQGWLALNISAHDLPIDEPDAFYNDLKEHALKNYPYIGSEDREKSYFLRMLLGCVRAADYLASRPDWDGRTLVVTGASQGGLQSFATAALDPKITEVMTLVPAGCDSYAPEAKPPRAFGWPYWLSNWGPPGRDKQKVHATAGYYDTINFAHRTHCPTLVGVGLLDDTARPTGVIAAYNSIPAPKELIVMPLSAHQGDQAAYFKRTFVWKDALKKGQPLPQPEKDP